MIALTKKLKNGWVRFHQLFVGGDDTAVQQREDWDTGKMCIRDSPTARYEVFSDPKEAVAYIEKNNQFPIVVKADGLALGKGVLIAANLEEAKDAVKKIMEDKAFGASGNQVVVEEFLTGPEVSVLAFTDGKCVKPMVSSKDHKLSLIHI